MKETIKILKEALHDVNYPLYLVGGWVRDNLMGNVSNDIDIMVVGDAQNVTYILHKKGILDYAPVNYNQYGTSLASINGVKVEFTSARKETYTEESRNPCTEFGDMKSDMFRRDFTFNALARDLMSDSIYDITGMGIRDLIQGVINTPLDPDKTFFDDPLRMLRAIRFVGKLNFTISEPVKESIIKNASRLSIISRERVRDELVKLVTSDNPTKGLLLMRDLGLLPYVIPELQDCVGIEQNRTHRYDVFEHIVRSVEAINKRDTDYETFVILRMAALLHDIGKPETLTIKDGIPRFYGHEKNSAVIASDILMNGLRFSREDTNKICFLIEHHMAIFKLDPKCGKTALNRFARKVGNQLNNLALLNVADRFAHGNAKSKYDLDLTDLTKVLLRLEEVPKVIIEQKRLSPLSGQSVMNTLDVERGKIVGDMLHYLDECVIDGTLKHDDKDKAKILIKEKIKTI